MSNEARKTNNKVRGGAFERRMCKELSLWWSDGKDDDVFYRTESSGGRGTTRARAGKQARRCGDVGTTDEIGLPLVRLMSIELKLGYSESTIQDMLDKPGAALQIYEKWLEQAEESAHNSGTPFWLIVVQRLRRKALAIMPAGLYKAFDVEKKTPKPMAQLILHRSGGQARTHLAVLRLDHFLTIASRARIEELVLARITEEIKCLSSPALPGVNSSSRSRAQRSPMAP